MNLTSCGSLPALLAILSLWTAIIVFIIVRAVMLRCSFATYAKPGLRVSLLCLALMLPSSILRLQYLDVSRLLGQQGSPVMDKGVLLVLIALVAAIALLVQAGWYLVVFVTAAGEWDRLYHTAFPHLTHGRTSAWRPYVGAFIFGLAAGALSTIVFYYSQVDISEAVKQMQRLFPGMDAIPLSIQVPVSILAFAVPAISEELIFRGVLLGFLMRVTRSTVSPIVFTSLLWAVMHVTNTDAPMLKCLQIFLIGLVLGALARRHSVEVCILAHVGLNVAAVLAGVLLM